MEHKDIVAAVIEAMEKHHPCRFDIDEKVVDHLIGMITNVGNGDLREGIERLRKNHEWLIARRGKDLEYTANHRLVSSMRETSESVAKQFYRSLAWGVIILVAFLIVFGVRLGLIKAGN